jgi:uncharacterized membrane protein YjgN (DUF898 family)
MRRTLLGVVVFAASFVSLAFLALPVIAVFARVSPGRLVAQLGNPVVTDALVVSLKTTLLAQALILVLGTPTAYLLATKDTARTTASCVNGMLVCRRPVRPNAASRPRPATAGGRTSGSSTRVMSAARPRKRRVASR